MFFFFIFLSSVGRRSSKAFSRAMVFIGAKAIAFTFVKQRFNFQQRNWSLHSSNGSAHRATCTRMIIQSLRLRSNSRTCWQVVLQGLSQEIRRQVPARWRIHLPTSCCLRSSPFHLARARTFFPKENQRSS